MNCKNYDPKSDETTCNCTDTCSNYVPKTEFEKGELAIYNDSLCVVKSDTAFDNARDCNVVTIHIVGAALPKPIVPVHQLSHITIGSKFTTKCDEDIFSCGVGGFVVVDREFVPYDGISKMRMYILESGDYQPHGRVVSHRHATGKRWIVLPSIDSNWWDKEIPGTGVWVRVYEDGVGSVLAYWNSLCSPYLWKINGKSNADYYISDAILDWLNPPIIPVTLRNLEHNGEFKAPKGATNEREN